MAELDLKALKSLIKEKINAIEDEILELKELTKPISPENAIGRLSRMDAINNKSINEAALRKSEEKYSKLKYALTKIDEEEFGICDRCGKDIQPRRLLLMPESNYCVSCAAR